MCYIPTNLRMYRIMGRNRKEFNKNTVEIPVRITVEFYPWIERQEEFVKMTSYGEIVIKKTPKRG